MKAATRSNFYFERIPPEMTTGGGGGVVYTTPARARVALGDLARMTYLRARFRALILFEASAPNNSEFRIKLTDGVRDYVNEYFNTDGSTLRYYIDQRVDLSDAAPDNELYMSFEDISGPDNAGDAGAEVFPVLTVDVPLIVLDGCGC